MPTAKASKLAGHHKEVCRYENHQKPAEQSALSCGVLGGDYEQVPLARHPPLWPHFTELRSFRETAFSNCGKLSALVTCNGGFHHSPSGYGEEVPCCTTARTKPSYHPAGHCLLKTRFILPSITTCTSVLLRWLQHRTTTCCCPPLCLL